MSGLALLGLSVFMATVRPRSQANLAFAAFAFFFGGHFITLGTAQTMHLDALVVDLLSLPFIIGWGAALVVLGWVFPVPLDARRRLFFWVAGGVWLLLVILGSLMFFSIDLASLFLLGIVLGTPTLFAFFLLMTLRFMTAREPGERRQTAITAAAVAPFVAVGAGRGYGPFVDGILLAEGWLVPLALARFLVVLAAAGLWLYMTRGQGGRTARNMVVFILFTLFLGLLVAYHRLEIPVYSITRFFMVVILTYAIFRHQFLGVDLKVRRGVSGSVLAGVFIAVFFLVTELTKWWVESHVDDPVLGGVPPTVLGIVAASLLLFAISPLQRLADQVARAAVPISGPAPGVPPERREVSYRRMVERFLRDGELSRDEERTLAELAGDLGIDAGRAFALRDEVENELRARAG